ncbi:MAG: glycoside hydrolase family 3 N-terminal domain-containing protein, partial [Bacteroidales bacterium]|nr:glycoside hydrolase family 3 N-terminal domain-containing protein [Bacteroidales bacterium]
TMNKKFATITMAMSMAALVGCTDKAAGVDQAAIDEIVKGMSLEEKASFVIGTNRVSETPPDAPECIKKYPMICEQYQADAEKHGVNGWDEFQSFVATYSTQGRVPGAAGQHYELPSLQMRPFVYADGPAGLRIDPLRKDSAGNQLPGEYYCTAFPTETALAATWDLSLVERVTKAMGEEVKEYGVDILLAPAINIHRNPLCGRNFEYFSEDPILAGKMAAAYINGVQSNGVGTSLKHFAVNNQETHRNGVNEVVSMRAMREIYLRGFEIAVKESQPWTIMSSYNKINGTFASENKWLLEDLLRGEWGYEGFVMTDWWAQENAVRQQIAGNDLIMPGSQRQYDELVAGLKDGSLPEEVVDRNISRILGVMMQTPTAQGYQYSNKPDLQAHAAVTREVACEGMVLLKNEEVGGKREEGAKALPLAAGAKVALFGNACYDILVGGSGSGNVNRKYKVSLAEGMKNCGFTVENATAEAYGKYLEAEKAKQPAENFWTVPVFDELLLTEAQVKAALAASDVAIYTLCRMAGEGGDRKNAPGDWQLSANEKVNVDLVGRVAHEAGKAFVVVLDMGNIIDFTDVLAANPDAVLHAWLGGQEAGNSIADVLSGKVNPSGRLPMTWAKKYEDYASSKNFPFTEGDSLTRYEEDVFVGYRQFDRDKLEPLFPFGFGLSYTTFDYSDMTAKAAVDQITVTVKVTNTGKVAGREVVQLYASAPAGNMPMPVKELKAFGKTALLEPGKSEVLTLTFPKEYLASWGEKGWTVAPGEYTLSAAASAADIRQTAKVKM